MVIAAKNAEPGEITWEVADLWFHSLVLLAANGLSPADIWQEARPPGASSRLRNVHRAPSLKRGASCVVCVLRCRRGARERAV